MKKMLMSLTVMITLVCQARADSGAWNYLDYDGKTHTAVLEFKRTLSSILTKKHILTLSDFAGAVDLPKETEELLVNEQIPLQTRIRSKSEPSIVLYGVMLSKDSKSVQSTREFLNELHKIGSIKKSGDELCPASTERVLILAIRDFAALPYCLTKK